METVQIEQFDIDKAGNGYEALGPAYFAARRMAEQLLAGTEPEPIKAVADKCVDLVKLAVYEYVEVHILSDLESNIQNHVRRMVENTVTALLTGDEWAMRQYPFHDYSDGERVRAAVAKHGGDPLLMARIADLEKENARLTQDVKWMRESRY